METKRTLRRRVEDLRRACSQREKDIADLLLEKRELKAALRDQETAARREREIREIMLEKKEVALRAATKARLKMQEELQEIEEIRDRYLPAYIADKEALRLAAGDLQQRAREISHELLRMSEAGGLPDDAAEKLSDLSHTLLPELDYTDTQQLREAGYYTRTGGGQDG